MPRRRRLAVPVAAAVLTLTACGAAGRASAYQGEELTPPIALPAATLTTTAGQPYDVRQQAKGTLAIYYFGYTHCPDVCPTTMADLGTALRSLPAADQRQVQVVFVTTDPAHDTPAALRSWLANFDRGLARPFVGLRGALAAVQATAGKFGVAAESPQTDSRGNVTDTHGAQVIAFSPSDSRARVLWVTGTTPNVYAHDIKALLAS